MFDQPLCDELKAYLEPFPALGPNAQMLRHPLVFAVPYYPGSSDGFYNQVLERKQRSLTMSRINSDWRTYIWLHERPFRLQALLTISHRLANREYWQLLLDVWIDSEAPNINHDLFVELFSSDRSGRDALMREDQRQALKKLPKVLTVYRGIRAVEPCSREDGLSFTLERDTAVFFARRYGHSGRVLTATVHKRHVLAYVTDRNEAELVILPGKVKFIDNESVRGERDA